MKKNRYTRAVLLGISLVLSFALVPAYLSSHPSAHSNAVVLADGTPMPPPEPLPPPPPPGGIKNALLDGTPMPPPEPLPPPPPPGGITGSPLEA
jgi:hypothetical protein